MPRDHPNSTDDHCRVARETEGEKECGYDFERQNKIGKRREEKCLHAGWCLWIYCAEIGGSHFDGERNLSRVVQ